MLAPVPRTRAVENLPLLADKHMAAAVHAVAFAENVVFAAAAIAVVAQ